METRGSRVGNGKKRKGSAARRGHHIVNAINPSAKIATPVIPILPDSNSLREAFALRLRWDDDDDDDETLTSGCVGSMVGGRATRYIGGSGAPLNWNIWRYCPRWGSVPNMNHWNSSGVLYSVMMLDTSAQGFCTWIRPSAGKGLRTNEPLGSNEYLPCCQMTTPSMHLGCVAGGAR